MHRLPHGAREAGADPAGARPRRSGARGRARPRGGAWRLPLRDAGMLGARAEHRRAGARAACRVVDRPARDAEGIRRHAGGREQRRRGRAMTRAPESERRVHIPQAIIVKDLAGLLHTTPIEVIKELMKNGVMATINQVVDFDTAAVVASDLGFVLDEGRVEAPIGEATDERTAERPGASLRIVEEAEGLQPRSPVVTVLGHVDHGKTTLLDRIRRAHVAEGEAGGITQRIGAYQATAPDGRTVTFIDTPGHAAFTEMRARGARVTDVAVVVVAADDGVMPQTREAIDHARAAGVPIVIALNKIDVDNANPDRAKQQLMALDLVPEEYGGDTVLVAVSALKGQGIDDLLESVLLVSDLDPPRANPDRPAVGVVLDASTDRHRGVVATLLVQTGTLRQGDAVLSGLAHGRAKALEDQNGKRVKEAGPSMPVVMLGLSEVPLAGQRFEVVVSDRDARGTATERRRAAEAGGGGRARVTLDSLFGAIHRGAVADFNVVLKTDSQGSLDPLVRALNELSVDEVNVKVVHAAPGTVNESDVNLAVASHGVILGFNVEPEPGAQRLADAEHVEIRRYDVIYQLLEDVERAVQGLLKPVFEQREDGRVEVRAIFRLGRRNAIAGCYVQDGNVKRDSLIRVLRGGQVVHESKVASLKRFNDDVREVASGYECGIMADGFSDFEVGDQIVAYHMEQVR
ncbi:MAG: translation initiation factor IF-2 [Dehalococcoidia bacterium]|nr:translation initiation factor IF-2 [Dehalococcoidia bacterium]